MVGDRGPIGELVKLSRGPFVINVIVCPVVSGKGDEECVGCVVFRLKI
jgi:hypothetical protein